MYSQLSYAFKSYQSNSDLNFTEGLHELAKEMADCCLSKINLNDYLEKNILFSSVTLLSNNNDCSVLQIISRIQAFSYLALYHLDPFPTKPLQICYKIRGKMMLNSAPWILEEKG